jgi:hypothetical protein
VAVGGGQVHECGELPELPRNEGVDLLLTLDGEPGQDQGESDDEGEGFICCV